MCCISIILNVICAFFCPTYLQLEWQEVNQKYDTSLVIIKQQFSSNNCYLDFYKVRPLIKTTKDDHERSISSVQSDKK